MLTKATRLQNSGSTDPALVRNYGFTAREVNELYRMVNESRQRFIEAWHDYFGTDR